jgi:UDP-N-acetylmuramate dehydrogenase
LAPVNGIEPSTDVPLAPLTTLGIGGRARWYVRTESIEQVQAAHRWAAARQLPIFILGGGSNIVVADEGFPGLVMHIALDGAELRGTPDEALIDAGAGEPWDRLVARIVNAGYAGVECLSGIPGLVGGTPIQNVGAYGQDVSEVIESVITIDRHNSELISLQAKDCGFSYRQSRFKQQDADRFIVCRVRFRVRRGPPTVTYPDVMAWIERRRLSRPSVGDVREAVLEIRRGKGMVLDSSDPDTRSVGSFFMNPLVPASVQAALRSPAFPMANGRVKIPAAWLIEHAGFHRGFTAGAAAVSSKHPLAIVNRGGAHASDILDLACRIKRTVLDRFGVALYPEPVFVGFAQDERVRFLQKEHD